MRDHRQGNDLAVIWSILRDGKPFILSGKEWKLYLKNMYERKEVDDFSVKGNQIHWTFYGKDQKTTGRYSLILVGNENEKGMITTDTCNFVNVVSCSCKVQNSEDSPNVETETIELTSNLDYVAGTGGESSVFEAVYDVTPYSDIVEAYKANKHCICRYNNMFLSLVKLNYEGNDTAQFAAVVDDTQYAVYCFNNNKWSNTFIKVEKISNKVTSISQSSNNNEYPSAKAVYDFVNNTLGTIINGDY